MNAALQEPIPVRREVLRARVITDVEAWQSLRPCWDALLEASTDSTPWQSWDYLTSWWANLGTDKQLRIVVVEDDGVPVLVFPLQLGRESMIGLPTRILEPISMMWDVNRPRFALGEFRESAFRCGLEAIWAMRGEWDSLRIEEMPVTDPQSLRLLEFAAERELWFRHVLSSVCPQLRLDQSWDAFLATRGSKMRKNLRAAMRRLESHGPVRLECAQSLEEVHAAFDVMLDLHRRSWKRKKRVGLSLSENFRAFFRAFLLGMARRGRARVLTLYAGDRPVAATIAFLHLDTYFSTEIVHDAAFAPCSPGTLLESMEIRRLMQEQRLRHYDFLGRFLSNKQRWTDTARITHRIYVWQPSLKCRVLEMHYFRAKPLLKRLWRAVFGRSRTTAQSDRFVTRGE
jgi:CelD/BcsL family acetyltransferase involved in cellulose biosynthesis